MLELVEHAFQVYDDLAGGIRINDSDVREDDMDEILPKPVDDETADTVGEEDVDLQQGAEAIDDDIEAMDVAPPSQPELLESNATMPLYAGSSLTTLGATQILLNYLRTHGASNVLVNELFGILSISILPSINSLPTIEYATFKTLKQLGLAYDTIHLYPGLKLCILFRGDEHKDLQQCPECGTNRFNQVVKAKVPAKVLRHFPLIPRLQRKSSTPLQASYKTWHA